MLIVVMTQRRSKPNLVSQSFLLGLIGHPLRFSLVSQSFLLGLICLSLCFGFVGESFLFGLDNRN